MAGNLVCLPFRRHPLAQTKQKEKILRPNSSERDKVRVFCALSFQVSISETVCFRVEIPCSSPSSLENLFAVLFLGLYFAPHLNHPAVNSHQSSSAHASGRASSSPYRSGEGGASSKREAASPQEGADERSRRSAKRSNGSSARSHSKGSCKRGGSPSKNLSETLGDSTRLHTDSGVGTSNPQGTSDTGEGVAEKRGTGPGSPGTDSSGKRDPQSGGATCIAVKLLLISKFFKGKVRKRSPTFTET